MSFLASAFDPLAAFTGTPGEPLYFKNPSVYIQGAKWGLAVSSSLKWIQAGGEQVFDRGEYVGASWGVLKSELQIESFVPTVAKRYHRQVFQALTQGAYVFCTVGEVGGLFIQLGWMQIRSCGVVGKNASGTNVLDITAEGGSPQALESTPQIPLRLGGI